MLRKSLVALLVFEIVLISVLAFFYFRTKNVPKVEEITTDRTLNITSLNDETNQVSFGISKDTHFPPVVTGISRYQILGILQKKPYFDEKGFLVFDIQIPSKGEGVEQNVKIGAFGLNGPGGGSVFAVAQVGIVGNESNYNAGSLLTSLEEIVKSSDFQVGKQVAILFLFGEEKDNLMGYLESLKGEEKQLQCGVSCQNLVDKTLENLNQSYQAFDYLNGNSQSVSEIELYVLATHVFIQK